MTECFVTPDCLHNGPLGMSTGAIRDSQISASSNYPPEWDKGCNEKYARVYQPNGVGWCAKFKSASEWLQVDLGVPAKVSQTTSHCLSYSVSHSACAWFLCSGGKPDLFWDSDCACYAIQFRHLYSANQSYLLKSTPNPAPTNDNSPAIRAQSPCKGSIAVTEKVRRCRIEVHDRGTIGSSCLEDWREPQHWTLKQQSSKEP